jgi:hypothetical protein
MVLYLGWRQIQQTYGRNSYDWHIRRFRVEDANGREVPLRAHCRSQAEGFANICLPFSNTFPQQYYVTALVERGVDVLIYNGKVRHNQLHIDSLLCASLICLTTVRLDLQLAF